jgi:SP family facilitated glucose transporter-like MFS transporter 8
MLFQQTTGVNLILLNLAHRFAGGSSSTNQYDKKIRWLSVGSSFTQVVTSMLGAFLIDLRGRRIIWTVSLSGIAVVLGVYAGLLSKHHNGGTGETIVMFLFISLFGLGCGPIPWFHGAEVFPSELRPRAMSIIASVNWLFACVVMQIQSNYAQGNDIGDSWITFTVLAVFSLAGAIFGWFFVWNTPAGAKKGQVIDDDPYAAVRAGE